jgi:hypothetical protein
MFVVDEVNFLMYKLSSPDHSRPQMFTHYLQASISAAREEVAKLLFPPPFLYRRRAYLTASLRPTPSTRSWLDTKTSLRASNEALEAYRRTTLATAD